MATINNLYIDQGSDYASTITVRSATGLPLNLTGYYARAQIRKSHQSTQAYDFNCDIVDAPLGKLRLTLSAETNEQMKPGRWLYDVEITQESTGTKKRVVEGLVVLTPQITRV